MTDLRVIAYQTTGGPLRTGRLDRQGVDDCIAALLPYIGDQALFTGVAVEMHVPGIGWCVDSGDDAPETVGDRGVW